MNRQLDAALQRHARRDPFMPRGAARHRPRVHDFEVAIAGLDPAHDGLRIAHLTDVHVGSLTPQSAIRGAVELANEAGADVIALTGDYVIRNPAYVPLVEKLLSGLRGHVVAVLGNHDYWTDGAGVARALERNGYTVLRNQNTTLRLRGRDLDVVGVDDAVTRRADVEMAFRGVRQGPGAPSRLVLTHAPGVIRKIAPRGGALVLAGHTHGGQIHVPRLSQKLWSALGWPYIKGFYQVDDATLYVNCGVGVSALPLRAGAPNEVAVFTLRCPRPAASAA